jgi:hypothetical protein
MRLTVFVPALLCTALSGCISLPTSETHDAPAGAAVPGVATSTPPNAPPGEVLEERHRMRAKANARNGNWADALMHWELLALLRPNNQEYQEAVTETRSNIARQAAHLLQLAELARKQGNLDQAELWYLRVLNVDRENTVAAQALRDLEADRTKRAYSNRPPRMRMQ